ncbi:glycosyltransferase family 4 protein [Janthinobacterium sp.]|uniref:glycosyltransferase family 4 protein n=1 Tax=Janthinobacterium sp. TaxID=1871054 RepID=UPI00293D33F1|nr:glycosyltransferase family 4 protein [Janthinobacterium sp.]
MNTASVNPLMPGSGALRVGFLSYPMLYQRTGGLQIQILETMKALRALGVQAHLIDPNTEALSDYDLIHVFSAINGNHRLLETARSLGCKVVLSPLIRPSWTRWTGWRDSLLDRIVGRLSGWHLQTSYAQILSALTHADKIVALGEIERASIQAAFAIPAERIVVIENGVTQRFFDATPEAFQRRWGIQGKFVLNVAAINAHKNQLALVRALEGQDVPIVLIGECLSEDAAYLAKLTASPNVRYLGRLAYDDAALCSAYAAATVFALPSESEVMPLSVMEALAAGTPAVMTDCHSMRLPRAGAAVKEHSPSDIARLRTLLLETLAHPSAAADCKGAVEQLRWSSVAERLLAVYHDVLGEQERRPAKLPRRAG